MNILRVELKKIADKIYQEGLDSIKNGHLMMRVALDLKKVADKGSELQVAADLGAFA